MHKQASGNTNESINSATLDYNIICILLLSVATVSFSSSTYRINEDAGRVQVIVTRSGNQETTAVVSVSSDSFQGTAAGRKMIILHIGY